MTHIPKQMWPAAFKEGGMIADLVLGINKEQKQFAKRGPTDIVTDRELNLAACVKVFFAYHASQEASHAAKRLFWERLEARMLLTDNGSASDKRLLKKIREFKNDEGGEGFLLLWGEVERFLAAASTPEFWANFKQPHEAILGFRQQLEGVAQSNGKEEDHGKTESSESSSGGTEGQAGAEGGEHSPVEGSGAGALEASGGSGSGADREGGGVQEHGERAEAGSSEAQAGDEKPDRATP